VRTRLPGHTVQIRLLGLSTWSTGICKGLVAPRSYEVEVDGTYYRCNRRHITGTDEQPTPRQELPSSLQEDNYDIPPPVQSGEGKVHLQHQLQSVLKYADLSVLASSHTGWQTPFPLH